MQARDRLGVVALIRALVPKVLRLGSMAAHLAAALIAVACKPPVLTYVGFDKLDASTEEGSQADSREPCADPVLVQQGALYAASAVGFKVKACSRSVDGGATEAVFSWTSYLPDVQSVPYGPMNRVSPGNDAQGQPESFPVGAQGRFVVVYGDPSVTWQILDQTVTALRGMDTCTDECTREQLAGPDSFLVDTCTEACGDGRCDHESCRSCPADCDCTAIEPLVDCVRVNTDGTRVASFGYRNGGARAGGISVGPENMVSPGAPSRSQPTYFPPGEKHDAFVVTYDGSVPAPTWTLGGLSVTATSDAPLCKEECGSCPLGTTCIGNVCTTSCGDGVCTEGDCLTCPDDCPCSGDQICYHGACFNPPRCGVELYCGSTNAGEVHLECGDCDPGLVCVIGVCQHVCPSNSGPD